MSVRKVTKSTILRRHGAGIGDQALPATGCGNEGPACPGTVPAWESVRGEAASPFRAFSGIAVRDASE
jgi:hypothetical protein